MRQGLVAVSSVSKQPDIAVFACGLPVLERLRECFMFGSCQEYNVRKRRMEGCPVRQVHEPERRQQAWNLDSV